jgi:hypothetical protein
MDGEIVFSGRMLYTGLFFLVVRRRAFSALTPPGGSNAYYVVRRGKTNAHHDEPFRITSSRPRFFCMSAMWRDLSGRQ